MKRSYEERMHIVTQALAGKTVRQLSFEYGLHECKILEWIRLYKKYGAEILRSKPRFKASGVKKEKLVRMVLEKNVPLSLIVVEYLVSRAAIERWVKNVRSHGYKILYRNKPLKKPTKKRMPRRKKIEPQTELEKLQAENLRLRAENALLKKVKALVEEEEALAMRSGQKPSTN